jgi:hypothetical protein
MRKNYLIGFGALALLLGALSLGGCKGTEEGWKKEAVSKAKAEYRCDDVDFEEISGHYIKLNVCGKVRWYKCKGS